MIKIQAHTLDLAGSSYEIGTQYGGIAAAIPPLRKLHTAGFQGFGSEEAKDAIALFDRWCPGLSEELAGFADTLDARPEEILFYAMTYLLPRCSHIALLPGATRSGHPLLARNYEFSHAAEDFSLIRTSIKGKYTHMGTSVLHFGRDEGVNERGLAVTISSCGFPVGADPFMRAPKRKGLQFWAVIRALLENCADVPEALEYLKDMPIAYNMNLILLDKTGRAALVETLDGRMAHRCIDAASDKKLLMATNHPVLPELIPHEPQAMAHSLRRYEWLEQVLADPTDLTPEQLKGLLLSAYPNGLCCHYFEEYFGTTKSMVIDPADGTIELCWGGRRENGWHKYQVDTPLPAAAIDVTLTPEKADPAIYRFVPLKGSLPQS